MPALPAVPPFPDGSPTADVHIRNVFYRLGFNNREAVALCGAHTLGRAFMDRSGVCENTTGSQGATRYTQLMSVARADGVPGVGMAGGCSWTTNFLTFDNSYFRRETMEVQEGARPSQSTPLVATALTRPAPLTAKTVA